MKLIISFILLSLFVLSEGYLLYYFSYSRTQNNFVSIMFAGMLLFSIAAFIYFNQHQLSKWFMLISILVSVTSSVLILENVYNKKQEPKKPVQYDLSMNCGMEKFLVDRIKCRELEKKYIFQIEKDNLEIEKYNEKIKKYRWYNVLSTVDVIACLISILLSISIPVATHSIGWQIKYEYENQQYEKKTLKEVYVEYENQSDVEKLYRKGLPTFKIAMQLKTTRYKVEKELIEKGLLKRQQRSTRHQQKSTKFNNEKTMVNNENITVNNDNIVYLKKEG